MTGPENGAGGVTPPAGPLLIRSDQQTLRFGVLPDSDVEGTRRAVANGVAGTACMVNMLAMPPGQASPQRSFNGEHIVFQLDGSSTWVVDGVEHVLQPRDLLFIPADRPYSVRNDGDVDASFLDVAGKVDAWPPSMSYDDGTTVASGRLDGLFNVVAG